MDRPEMIEAIESFMQTSLKTAVTRAEIVKAIKAPHRQVEKVLKSDTRFARLRYETGIRWCLAENITRPEKRGEKKKRHDQ